MTTGNHDRTVWIRAILTTTLLILAAGSVAQAAADIFSVNFYAWGRTNQGPDKEWNLPEWRETLTLEPNQVAGVGDWSTTGWVNYYVPWAPAAPQDPVTITSNQGSAATFTLITCRNGAPYHWTAKRTTLLGDGNGDLMDGHANATEQDNKPFEMIMSDIPFGEYDVIVYLGGNEGQWGDGRGKIVFNEGPEQDFYLGPNAEFASFAEIVDATTAGNYIVYKGVKGSSFTLRVRGNGFNHLAPCGFQFRQAAREFAADPKPADESADVPRDVVLSWTAGEFAAPTNGHKVYFGESFNDVTDATDAVVQTATRYTPPALLEFDTTYYWRVDEVNGPPDSTIYKGNVWSFTTELVAYLITDVRAAASSSANTQTEPANLVNGSGLTLATDGQWVHGTDEKTMWQSAPSGLPATVVFEFDRSYKLHEMKLWNHNTSNEILFGLGAKEVTIEVADSNEGPWTAVADVTLTKASGLPNTPATDTIPMLGVMARNVRLTIRSSQGGFATAGLAEVRFLYIPVAARELTPADGTALTVSEATLAWRSGREATEHRVYLATAEERTLVEGSDPAALEATVPAQGPYASYTATGLDLSQTYLWKITEVNVAEIPATHDSPILSFTMPEYLVVDDMESYKNDSPNRVFQTWIDGVGFSPDEFFPQGNSGNGSGSGVGHDIWTPGTPYTTITETTTFRTGKQSMPLYYDNTASAYSETTRTFDSPQNWTQHGIKGLTLWFRGDPGNVPQQMYVKINNTKVPYDGDAARIVEPRWIPWDIALDAPANQGVNLQSVTQLSIGFDRLGGAGGQGLVFFDDIQLHPASEVSSISITVPNGDFEEIYKPGSTTIAADLGGGWTQGLGPNAPMDDGAATYSDGTTGDAVDIPGWVGADAQGWIDNEGTYGRDTSFPNRQGSVARQMVTPDGLYYYLSNGGDWGNPAGGLIVSDVPVATVESGLTYTLSVLATGPDGPATPVVLELLADGAALTPSSSVNPELSGDWQEVSRTYDAASLAGHIGESLTIRLGVGRKASGGQTCFDAVSLSYVE